MNFRPISDTEYRTFFELLNAYYREGEDAQTDQQEINSFIELLFELCKQRKICGCIAYDTSAVGFVLWNVDSVDGPFSNKPGFGTILEIGVVPERRGNGFGKLLADHARSQMKTENFYVCAYGPAEAFWMKCGYHDSGEIADNGLKIFVM